MVLVVLFERLGILLDGWFVDCYYLFVVMMELYKVMEYIGM